jgi:hypothetical protein
MARGQRNRSSNAGVGYTVIQTAVHGLTLAQAQNFMGQQATGSTITTGGLSGRNRAARSMPPRRRTLAGRKPAGRKPAAKTS